MLVIMAGCQSALAPTSIPTIPSFTTTLISPTITAQPTATFTASSVPPTATPVPPTLTRQPTATLTPLPTPTPFVVVSAKTGQEEGLSVENEKLHEIIEKHLAELYRNTTFEGLAVNYGDPKYLAFLYFYGGVGSQESVHLQKDGEGRFDINFSGNILYVWNNLSRTSVLIPRTDESAKTVFDVKQNHIEFQDSNGKVIVPEPLPDYATLVPRCAQGGQELHVYDPGRLEVLSLCVRVSGIVKSISKQGEGDGDFTFEVALDPPFKNYVNDENRKVWNGNIHVEIVCHTAGGGYAYRECKNFPESLRVEPPRIGQHIWLEGQWVQDWGHTGWTELHPLFRWEPYK